MKKNSFADIAFVVFLASGTMAACSEEKDDAQDGKLDAVETLVSTLPDSNDIGADSGLQTTSTAITTSTTVPNTTTTTVPTGQVCDIAKVNSGDMYICSAFDGISGPEDHQNKLKSLAEGKIYACCPTGTECSNQSIDVYYGANIISCLTTTTLPQAPDCDPDRLDRGEIFECPSNHSKTCCNNDEECVGDPNGIVDLKGKPASYLCRVTTTLPSDKICCSYVYSHNNPNSLLKPPENNTERVDFFWMERRDCVPDDPTPDETFQIRYLVYRGVVGYPNGQDEKSCKALNTTTTTTTTTTTLQERACCCISYPSGPSITWVYANTCIESKGVAGILDKVRLDASDKDGCDDLGGGSLVSCDDLTTTTTSTTTTTTLYGGCGGFGVCSTVPGSTVP